MEINKVINESKRYFIYLIYQINLQFYLNNSMKLLVMNVHKEHRYINKDDVKGVCKVRNR